VIAQFTWKRHSSGYYVGRSIIYVRFSTRGLGTYPLQKKGTTVLFKIKREE
jgi:hypothetical protein